MILTVETEENTVKNNKDKSTKSCEELSKTEEGKSYLCTYRCRSCQCYEHCKLTR